MDNEAHMESSPGNQFSVSNADKNPPKHKFECKEIKSKQLAWKQIGETISYDHVQKHFPRIASPVFFPSISVTPEHCLSFIHNIY
jgi:hypothetical protein